MAHDDLSPEARSLLRKARGADRTSPEEIRSAVARFRGNPRNQARRPVQPAALPLPRRATPWAALLAILSGSLGAYATVGQSLGLPLPGWWPEVLAWSSTGGDVTALPAQAPSRTARVPSAVAAPRDHRPAAPEDPTVAAPSDVALAPSVSSSAPVGLVAPDAASAPSVPRGAPRAPSVTAPKRLSSASDAAWDIGAPPKAGGLSREVALVSAARDALRVNDCAAAERNLEWHRAEFPSGALADERRALTAVCACRTGADRSAALRYVEANPHSPLARRVAHECGL